MAEIKKHVKHTSIQLLKYGIVGLGNTAITFFVILVFNSVLGINYYISNVAGYIAGVLNSFIWNKKWVFKSATNAIKKEMALFIAGFAICYLIQLAFVWILMNCTQLQYIQIPGVEKLQTGDMIITAIGMIAYTLLNYAYNRFITFRQLS